VRSSIVELDFGRCALVSLSDDELADALAGLHEDERAVASQLGERRRREHVAGRVAMRMLLPDAPPIGVTDRGGPQMPDGWVGSISHKPALAAALVAPAGDVHVGVDLEVATARAIDVSPRILTPREQAALPDRGAAVTLRFAIKEAIYKAVDPFVRRYVGFTEVELDVGDDGSCAVTIVDPARLPVSVEARWQAVDGFWLATARALRS
jgi:4'-phosphopantetheinyl transferase EntD